MGTAMAEVDFEQRRDELFAEYQFYVLDEPRTRSFYAMYQDYSAWRVHLVENVSAQGVHQLDDFHEDEDPAEIESLKERNQRIAALSLPVDDHDNPAFLAEITKLQQLPLHNKSLRYSLQYSSLTESDRKALDTLFARWPIPEKIFGAVLRVDYIHKLACEFPSWGKEYAVAQLEYYSSLKNVEYKIVSESSTKDGVVSSSRSIRIKD